MGRSKHQATAAASRDNPLAAGVGRLPSGNLAASPVAANLAAVSLAIALFLGLAGAASAQGAVRSVHGDWQIRCDTPPGAQAEQCALIQSVVAEDRSNAGLTVIVLKTADQKSKLMRPAQWLCGGGGDGRQAVGPAAHRQNRDVHHFRDPRGGYRLSPQFERDRRGV
jgi:hypothetical protein